MAMLYEFRSVTGARVIVDDALMAKPGSPEEARIIEEQNRAAHACLLSGARQRYNEKHKGGSKHDGDAVHRRHDH